MDAKLKMSPVVVSSGRLLLILLITVCVIFLKHGYYFLLNSRQLPTDSLVTEQGRTQRCKPADLNPFNEDILPYLKSHSPINCTKLHNQNSSYYGIAFAMKDGHYLHHLEDVGVPCCIQPFYRETDDENRYSEKCHDIKDKVTNLPNDINFIEVLCKNQTGAIIYHDAFPVVSEKRINNYKLSTPHFNNNTLSVIILGLDTTSRLNFLRKMPKTSNYLLNELLAVSLKGYYKVGENTLPNLIPLLTGQTLHEFKQTCITPQNTTDPKLDSCNFLWKSFSDKGYRTAYAEDAGGQWPNFNRLWKNAFQSAPTDYYFRPYTIRMADFLDPDPFAYINYCYGPRLSLEVLLDFLKSIADLFKTDQRYFQLIWSIQLAHDDMNKLEWGDVLLYSLLQYLYESNLLNNTALVILGDHGYRFGGYPLTTDGRREGTMPVNYIVLPKWFRNKYPDAHRNLESNAGKMTSAFDMHKTLFEFMNLDRLNSLGEQIPGASGKGMSLFQDIPEDRTCAEAGIPSFWCPLCYPKTTVPLTSDVIGKVKMLISKSLDCGANGTQNSSDCSVTINDSDAYLRWDARDWLREFSAKLSMDDIPKFMKNANNISGEIAILQLTLSIESASSIAGVRCIIATQLETDQWFLLEQHVTSNTGVVKQEQ